MKCSCKTFFLSHPFKDILRSLLVSSAGHLQVFLRPVYHLHSQLWGCRVAMTMCTSRLPRMHWGDFGHHKGPQVVIEYGAQGCGVTLGVVVLSIFPWSPSLALSLRAVFSSPGDCGFGYSWSATWGSWAAFWPSWAFFAPSFVFICPASKLLCLCMDGADCLLCSCIVTSLS